MKTAVLVRTFALLERDRGTVGLSVFKCVTSLLAGSHQRKSVVQSSVSASRVRSVNREAQQ
jgi:hypothetical protein